MNTADYLNKHSIQPLDNIHPSAIHMKCFKHSYILITFLADKRIRAAKVPSGKISNRWIKSNRHEAFSCLNHLDFVERFDEEEMSAYKTWAHIT